MPDIDFQKIELNLIPKKGEQPVVFYASQYETARPFKAVLKWGDSEFAPGVDCYAEIDIRKNDDNLVVITDDVSIDNNEVSVILPVQALTCIGKNLGQVKIYEADDHLIAALNFILEVQADPLAGGVTSETAIDNIESQIAAIVPEVIGDDYYNKTETDALLADKADVSDLPDMSNYYTKSQTYSSSQIDYSMNLKADRSELDDYALKTWVTTNFVDAAYLGTHYYNKAQVDNLIDNIFPTFTASGAIASFTTALNKPLVSVTADPVATTITRCGVNLFDKTDIADGYIDDTTGEVSSGAYYKHTNYIPVVGGQKIYIMTEQTAAKWGAWYDKDKNYISGITNYSQTEATAPANACFIRLTCMTDDTGNLDTFGVNYPSSDTAYHAYEGQTVPVADARTLTTLSGVNNVFADSGDVTVQYKYMSM